MQKQSAAVLYKNQFLWGKQTKATHLYMSMYMYKTYSKEIHPGVTIFQEQRDSECIS